MWKQQRLREGKQQVRREVAELVEHLRLYLAFAPTPGAALRLVIQDAPEGILWRQLRRELDTILMDGPDVALHHVSEVLAVRTVLRRLVARVKAAQAGSTDLTTALQAATEEMTLDLRRELEEQVEAAPTRLIDPHARDAYGPLTLSGAHSPGTAVVGHAGRCGSDAPGGVSSWLLISCSIPY